MRALPRTIHRLADRRAHGSMHLSSPRSRLVRPVAIGQQKPSINLLNNQREARPAQRSTETIQVHHDVCALKGHCWIFEGIEKIHRRRAEPCGREPAHELTTAMLNSHAVASRIRGSAAEQRELVEQAKPLRPCRGQDLLCVWRRLCLGQALRCAAAGDRALMPRPPDTSPTAEHATTIPFQGFSTKSTGSLVHVYSLIPAQAVLR